MSGARSLWRQNEKSFDLPRHMTIAIQLCWAKASHALDYFRFLLILNGSAKVDSVMHSVALKCYSAGSERQLEVVNEEEHKMIRRYLEGVQKDDFKDLI